MYITRQQIGKMGNLLYETQQDNQKTIQLTKLVSFIYETDVINKQFLNGLTSDSLAYKSQINVMLFKIDSLSNFFPEYKTDIDSLTRTLLLNSENILEIKVIQQSTEQKIPQNSFLQQLNSIVRSSGKLSAEDFIPEFERLTQREKAAARAYVDYLNQNVPKESRNVDLDYLDSLISVARYQVEYDKKQTVEQLKLIKDREIQLLFSTLKTSYIITDVLYKLEKQIQEKLADLYVKETELTDRLSIISQVFLFVGIWISVLFLIVLIWDVYRQNKFIDQLEIEKNEKSNLLNAREQMTNALSHDLKTPMQAIGSYAKLLKSAKSKEDIDKYSTQVASSSQYVLRLVQDLLEFSKIQSGRIALNPSFVAVDLVIRELVQVQRDYFASSPIHVNVKTDEIHGLEFWMDEVKFKQILNNLLSNAFKFTPRGEISIGAEILVVSGKKQLFLKIKDTGVGIPDSFKPHLFEQFSQARQTDAAKGTGLGMFITKQLVLLFGGSIDFESDSQGTEFLICFPISEMRAKIHPSSLDWSDKLFWIIDDDEMQLELTQKSLASVSAKSVLTKDFYASKDLLETTKFSAIITDMQMPLLTGYEVLDTVRSSKLNASTKVIAFSGMDPEKITGFDGVISKSLSQAAFIEKIKHHLDGNPQQQMITEHKESSTKNDFSLDLIMSYAQNDKNSCLEMLEGFIVQSDAYWSELESAISKEDFENISFYAHKLSNFYKMIDAQVVVLFLIHAEQHPMKVNLQELVEIMEKVFALHQKALGQLR